jgi:predicted peptidase
MTRLEKPPALQRRAAPLASALALLLLALPAPSRAAAPDSAATGRMVIREAQSGGESHRFAVWLPPGFDAKKRWPAIVFLHGSGECGTDPLAPTRVGLGPVLAARPASWPFVVVFPQKPVEEQEWEERDSLVLAELDAASREFAIDPRRVALGGMSQGGHGAWVLGAWYPTRWSCLIPICGYGRAKTIAPRVARLPVWAFHGLRDDVVDPAEAQNIVAAVREERTKLGLDPKAARLTLFPDANHNSWDPACAEPGLAPWILEQHRKK